MGTVNVFLGGSGKYIAEEIKGQQAHFGLSLPDFIAFDLDSAPINAGAAALGDDLLTPAAGFGAAAMGVTVPDWAGLLPGRDLRPKPAVPGPSTRPEAAVMAQTAREMSTMPAPAAGLWALRAAGLVAFGAFMEPADAGAAATAAVRFKNRVQLALNDAGAGGAGVTVNIVASTAGGTGAGMFLPFTLWLAERALDGGLNIQTNLILVTSSAFDNVMKGGGAAAVEMQSKGRTGTFAIIRELDLLYRKDPRISYPVRRLPISVDGHPDLPYRLGSRLYQRVYWMGRRAVDVGADNVDTYRETDPLVRILSNEAAAKNLDAMTGPYEQRLLPSVVTVDYPRLARVQQFGGELAQEALHHLSDGADGPATTRPLFENPAAAPGELGDFLRDQHFKVFATGIGDSVGVTEPEMKQLVTPFTNPPGGAPSFKGMDVRAKLPPAGYNAADQEWQGFCGSLSADLKAQWTQYEQSIDEHLHETLRQEGDSFRRHVRSIADEYLNPEDENSGPHPLRSLQAQINQMTTDLDAVRTFFGHANGIQERLPKAAADKFEFQSAKQISQSIDAREKVMRHPPDSKPTGGLTPGKWISLILIPLAAGVIASILAGLFPGIMEQRWFAGIGMAIVTAGVMVLILRRSGGTALAERRREHVDRMLRLYESRVSAHAGHALFSAVHQSFVPRAQEAVDELDARVADLRSVYAELLANAKTQAIKVPTIPPHSVDQVGTGLGKPAVASGQFVKAFAERVRIEPQAAGDGRIFDLIFRITKADGAYATGSVVKMAGSNAKAKPGGNGPPLGAAAAGGLQLGGLYAAIDGVAMTALADQLPVSFEQALQVQFGEGQLAELDAYLAALVHKTPGGDPLPGPDPRRPSVDCPGDDPTFARLYVPSLDMLGLVMQCLNGAGGTLEPLVISEIERYLGPDGRPLEVPELGASVALLSIWDPGNIMDTDEAKRAHDTYYGLAKDSLRPGFTCASQWNFHILPELAAATAIELAKPHEPRLLPCVVARLLGSHPKEEGPTILELFYLLRAAGAIHEQVTGDNRQWNIRWDDESLPLIKSPRLAGESATNPFGPGVRVVNAFDAFHDFLLFDGVIPGGLLAGDQRDKNVMFADGELQLRQWANLGAARIADLQRHLVQRWWEVESREAAAREHEAMVQLLRQDVDLMDDADASGDWHRAVEFVLRSGHLRRRALASSAS